MIISKDGLRLTHLYTGTDGESHVEDVDYALQAIEGGAGVDGIAITGLTLRLWDGAPPKHDFHNTSRPQLVIHLAGSVEVECSDGSKRVLRPGEIMVSENTAPGRGHISNELEQPRLQLLIPYVNGFLPVRDEDPSTSSSRAE